MEDRLSQLPDEVIVSILSQLTIREAVQTSSLSIQWHYLWMYVTRLKFDVSQFITWKMFYYPRLCRKEGMKHINLINNVLDFHKGGHLEEFTLSFPFHKHFKRVIRWKSNLLLKNVTSVLTIDFKTSRALICELVHTFTTYFTLLTTLSLEFGHMGMDLHFLDHALPKFNNLKVLVLKVVGVTDESLLGITPLIEASPYLQKLHIELEWAKTTISKKKVIRKKCPISISKKSNIVVTLVVLLT
ncbi:putative F-box protein At3g58860 [Solanum tuberosum]|uniref:putative F-box protein At3g58860 n=1 Tax=Solanum tuberosum TaxID=4113 RepID=UPI00073A1646|nr:PREDICTED: putative F-box protein At3g58860 [Solanum tuberosum]